MDRLPNEILFIVFSFLDAIDLKSLSDVNKRLNQLAWNYLTKRKKLVICSKRMFGRKGKRHSNNILNYFEEKSELRCSFFEAVDCFKAYTPNISSLAIVKTNNFNRDQLYLVAKHLPNLCTLWLEEEKINDDSLINFFLHCGKLNCLILSAPKVSLNCFEFMPSLQEFQFNNTEDQVPCVEDIQYFSSLFKSLESFGFNIYESGFENVITKFEKLQTLRINNNYMRNSKMWVSEEDVD
ncbi:hypothetical protein B4U80_15033, partial [Leptotrombidium deliense]